MMSNRVSRLLQIVAILALAAVATPSLAKNCVFSGSGMSPIDFGTINVPRDAAVGTQLGPTVQTTINWSCPPNPGVPRTAGPGTTYNPRGDGYMLTGIFDKALDRKYSMSTGNPGVSLTLEYIKDGQTINAKNYAPNLSTINFGGVPSSASFTAGSITVIYKLHMTGAASSGQRLSMPSPFKIYSYDYLTLQNPPTFPTSSVAATIVSPTCSTNNVTVTLPTVSANALTTVGQTVGTTPFAIHVVCPGGTSTKVFMTMTDATTPGNRTSDLSLGPTSTATGVTVRISGRNGYAISYGPDSAVVGNPNQFNVSNREPTDGGTFDLNLVAAYVSTGAITPGSVKAVATFTMSYQ
jgi:type 1 fimbria pilin